jgi:hypothetical protein
MDPRDEVIDVDDAPAGALTTQPRANQIARQEFAGSSLSTTTGVTEALVAKARASVEAAMIAAKRWPRNMLDARDRVLRECRRPDFAAVAMYSVPRGAGRVEGLSIRFAEMALRSMGNMEATSETIYDDATSRVIRVRVVDYETNASVAVDFTVSKTKEVKELKRGQRPLGERTNNQGQRLFIVEATDDDVTTKQNAQVSKSMRTGILRLVPGDIQDEAKAIIRKTASDKTAKDPAAAQKRMLAAYASIGVKPSSIESWLGHTIETITQAELSELEGLFAAIREQETTWHEVLSAALAEREPASAKAPAPTPAASQASAAPAPRQSEPSVPPAEPQREATPARATRQSNGKGTAALKGALTSQPKPPATPKPDPAPASVPRPADDDEDPETEPAWMSERVPPPELPPDEPPPAPGNEYRTCPRCKSAVIEVPVSAPASATCYACSKS